MANAKTPKFRVSYPQVFEPKKNDLNGKMEYSVMAVFPKGADLSALKKAAEEEIEKKLGKDRAKWPKNLRSPFRPHEDRMKTDEVTGKEYLPEPFEAGGFWMNLKSTQKPQLVDQQVKHISDQSSFYPGCWAIASVNSFYYDQKGNKGISFGLGNLQKVADGDPLSGRTKAEDDFAPVESSDSGADTNSLFN